MSLDFLFVPLGPLLKNEGTNKKSKDMWFSPMTHSIQRCHIHVCETSPLRKVVSNEGCP